jgi:hypothetical protein
MASTPAGYKRIAIPGWVYDRACALRDELLRKGLDSLPEGALPPEFEVASARTIGLGVAIGIAIHALQERPRVSKRKQNP